MYEPTYRFHEIARVLANPSRRNRGVQWVFSPPVHCLQFSLRSTTRGPLAFAYVIEAQWGTHPDAGVTEGWHPPVLRRRIKGGGPRPIGNPVSQWASGIDPMVRIRSIPTDGLRYLSFASVGAVSQSDGIFGSHCGKRVCPSNPLRVGYAERVACLDPVSWVDLWDLAG